MPRLAAKVLREGSSCKFTKEGEVALRVRKVTTVVVMHLVSNHKGMTASGSNSEVPYCPSLVCFSTGKPTSSRTCRMLERSIPRLEDHVERRFRGATDLSKAACLDYRGKFHLSGLRAQRHAHLLR